METPLTGNQGWIGTQRQLRYYLEVMDADRDEQGRFILTDGGAFAFLGIEEDDNDVVIDGKTCFLLRGHKCNLAIGLGQTSYGHRVNVIA
jgi:hypothetical protein